MQGPRNAIGHTKIMADKDEVQPEDHVLLQKDRPDLIEGIHLVSCPWKNFDIATTKECSTCPWWNGFIPANRKMPLEVGNAWSVCGYPMGRRIQTVETKD